MNQLNAYAEQIFSLAVDFAPRLLLSISVWLLGWWLIERLAGIVNNSMERLKISKDIRPFLRSLVKIGLRVFLIFSVAGIVGIETASFVAVMAALGFAVGLALQGNLSNFASGVLILIFRPFKVGDEVKIKGNWSFVQEIQIFHTVLRKFDKTLIIIPNSVIMNDVIYNHSAAEFRRVTIGLKVPYSENLDNIQQVFLKTVEDMPEVLKTPEPSFWVGDFDTYFMHVNISVFTEHKDFWKMNNVMKIAVLEALKKNGIQVAYPTGVAFGKFGEGRKEKPVLPDVGIDELQLASNR